MSAVIDWFKELFSISAPRGAKPTAAPKSAPARAETRVRPQRQRNSNAVTKIETVYMRSYNQAMEIADILRADTTAIINVSGLSGADRARLVDFMAGLKAGLQAESSRVSEDVYLLAPYGMEIDLDADQDYEDDGDRLIVRP